MRTTTRTRTTNLYPDGVDQVNSDDARPPNRYYYIYGKVDPMGPRTLPDRYYILTDPSGVDVFRGVFHNDSDVCGVMSRSFPHITRDWQITCISINPITLELMVDYFRPRPLASFSLEAH